MLYDLTYHSGQMTIFQKWENDHHIKLAEKGDNPLVNVGGKYYELWQVSNILVGFSAYYALYTENQLNLWSALHNVAGGNWLYEDQFDKELYRVGYAYAKAIEEGDGNMTTWQLQWLIELWTAARKERSANLNAFDYVNKLSDQTFGSAIKWAIGTSR